MILYAKQVSHSIFILPLCSCLLFAYWCLVKSFFTRNSGGEWYKPAEFHCNQGVKGFIWTIKNLDPSCSCRHSDPPSQKWITQNVVRNERLNLDKKQMMVVEKEWVGVWEFLPLHSLERYCHPGLSRWPMYGQLLTLGELSTWKTPQSMLQETIQYMEDTVQETSLVVGIDLSISGSEIKRALKEKRLRFLKFSFSSRHRPQSFGNEI